MKKKLFTLIITAALLLTACSDSSPDPIQNTAASTELTVVSTTTAPVLKPWYEDITADSLSMEKEFKVNGKTTLLCSDGERALYQSETEQYLLNLSTHEMITVPSEYYFSGARFIGDVIAAKCSKEKKAILLDKTTLKEISAADLSAYDDFAIADENTAYILDNKSIKKISGVFGENPVITNETVADDYYYVFVNFEDYITHYSLEYSGNACFLKGMNDFGEVAAIFVKDFSLGFTYSIENKAFMNSNGERVGEILIDNGELYFADYRFEKYIPAFIERYDLNEWTYKTEMSFCSPKERLASLDGRAVTLENSGKNTTVRRYEKDGALCGEVSVPIDVESITAPYNDAACETLIVSADGKLFVLNWDYSSKKVTDGREKAASITNLKDVIEKLTDSIKNKYDLNVYYGEAATGTFSEYDTAPCIDERTIFTALAVLNDNVLAHFPNGFFSKMIDGNEITGYDIYLTGTISSNNEYSLSYAGGVTNVENNRQILLVDIQYPDYNFFFPTENSLSTTIAHEIWHSIEAYVNRLFTLYPEKDYYDLPNLDYWYVLNPTDFCYSYEYNGYFEDNGSNTLYAEDAAPDNTYFIDTYAKVNALEDKARLFETIYSGIRLKEGAFESKALMEKARYLCSVIRVVYEIPDNTELYWERLIGKVEKYSYYEKLQEEYWNSVFAVG